MPFYGQAVITDQEQGLFYTVGGTSGFNYFMDVNVLDLRSSPPAWQSLYRLSGLDDEPEARLASKTFQSRTFKIVSDVKLVSGTGMSSVSTTTNYMYWVEAPASLLTGDLGIHNLQFQKSMANIRFEELPTFDLAEKRWTYTRTKPDSAATIDNSDDGFPEARRCHGTVQVNILSS